MNKLTTNQKVAIELGMRQRKGLIRQTIRMAKKVKSTTAKYVDQLIAGPSGTGKSFNILKTLRSQGLQFFEMTGNASIFGFMGNLLYLHSQKPNGKKLVIFLDDCDFLFEPKNINILKNLTATDPQDRKFQYTKAVNEKQFSDAQQHVLPNYLNEGTHGLTIPCDEFVFVIASNIELYDETQLSGLTASQKKTAEHHLAIRGRMKPYDFKLTKDEKWGWIYDAGMNDGALDMLAKKADKLFLLNWMWSNWDQMKETSIRTIEKMAEDMIEDPSDFVEYWELDYLVKL
mgnify:FL=1|tara:strand:- start:175 stop:1035 length:861 start_codon:yes stop_codon:yes gene_type:complete